MACHVVLRAVADINSHGFAISTFLYAGGPEFGPKIIDNTVAVVVFAVADLLEFSLTHTGHTRAICFALVLSFATRGMTRSGLLIFKLGLPGIIDDTVAVIVFAIADLGCGFGSDANGEFALLAVLYTCLAVSRRWNTGPAEGVVLVDAWGIVDVSIAVIV